MKQLLGLRQGQRPGWHGWAPAALEEEAVHAPSPARGCAWCGSWAVGHRLLRDGETRGGRSTGQFKCWRNLVSFLVSSNLNLPPPSCRTSQEGDLSLPGTVKAALRRSAPLPPPAGHRQRPVTCAPTSLAFGTAASAWWPREHYSWQAAGTGIPAMSFILYHQ